MVKIRLMALMLVLLLLLSGCDLSAYLEDSWSLMKTVAYQDMVYTRPDMDAMEESLRDACAAAGSARNAGEVMDAVYGFYGHYDSFLTNWYLANIRYSGDLTNSYWEAEYSFCSEKAPWLDAALEQMYRALAVSPMRAQLEADYFGEDYFVAYEGENSAWDEHTRYLQEQEAKLENEYYALANEALSLEPYSEEYFETFGPQMASVLAELVALRQELAAYLGYESYTQLAYDGYYYRDYTPEQAVVYLEQLGDALSGPYGALSETSAWDWSYTPCSQEETFAYLKEAATAMGGTVKHAFDLLEEAGLYDIASGPNKYDASFEVYLWDYAEPFIFMNPYLDQTDKLTFAHEFGHFANDYVCGGSYAGTDVAEVHSQAFEYLSLCYTENSEELEAYKMADSLSTFTECAAYALFEHRLYALDEPTPEEIAALYEQTCREFGFDSWAWDSRDFVTVTHFYTDPMYMISYVVSNDLALQFYQKEQKLPGRGLSLYESILTSEDTYLIAFAESYGLENPFAEGRPEALARVFEGIS